MDSSSSGQSTHTSTQDIAQQNSPDTSSQHQFPSGQSSSVTNDSSNFAPSSKIEAQRYVESQLGNLQPLSSFQRSKSFQNVHSVNQPAVQSSGQHGPRGQRGEPRPFVGQSFRSSSSQNENTATQYFPTRPRMPISVQKQMSPPQQKSTGVKISEKAVQNHPQHTIKHQQQTQEFINTSESNSSFTPSRPQGSQIFHGGVALQPLLQSSTSSPRFPNPSQTSQNIPNRPQFNSQRQIRPGLSQKNVPMQTNPSFQMPEYDDDDDEDYDDDEDESVLHPEGQRVRELLEELNYCDTMSKIESIVQELRNRGVEEEEINFHRPDYEAGMSDSDEEDYTEDMVSSSQSADQMHHFPTQPFRQSTQSSPGRLVQPSSVNVTPTVDIRQRTPQQNVSFQNRPTRPIGSSFPRTQFQGNVQQNIQSRREPNNQNIRHQVGATPKLVQRNSSPGKSQLQSLQESTENDTGCERQRISTTHIQNKSNIHHSFVSHIRPQLSPSTAQPQASSEYSRINNQSTQQNTHRLQSLPNTFNVSGSKIIPQQDFVRSQLRTPSPASQNTQIRPQNVITPRASTVAKTSLASQSFLQNQLMGSPQQGPPQQFINPVQQLSRPLCQGQKSPTRSVAHSQSNIHRGVSQPQINRGIRPLSTGIKQIRTATFDTLSLKTPPTDADKAKMFVLELQQSLDIGIQARKTVPAQTFSSPEFQQPSSYRPISLPVQSSHSTNLGLSGRPVCSVTPFVAQTSNSPQVRPNAAIRPRQPALAQRPSSLQTQSHTQPPRPQQHFQQNLSLSERTVIPEQLDTFAESSRSDQSIRLDKLSEEQCEIDGKKFERNALIVNQVYQIKAPTSGEYVYAIWNGEKFEDINGAKTQAAGNQSTPPRPSSAATKKPVSKFEACFIQSLQKTNRNQEEKKSPTDNNSSTIVRALEPQNSTQDTSITKPKEQEMEAQQTTQEEDDDDDDDTIFKKPYSEDAMRVCNNCGYTSRNFKRCEGCKRLFTGEVKVYNVKKSQPSPAPASVSSSSSASRPGWKADSSNFGQTKSVKPFYSRGRGRARGRPPGRTRGGGLVGRSGARAGAGNSDDSNDDRDSDSSPVKRKLPKKGKAPPKKKTKKNDEPVTVMISSDEDEPSSTSNNPSTQSPGGSSTSSEFFPMKTPEPSLGFGRFRRMAMQDEQGNSIIGKKVTMNRPTDYDDEDYSYENEEEEDEDVYEVEIRSIRVGSLRTNPETPLLISKKNGLCFRTRAEGTEDMVDGEISPNGIENIKYSLGPNQPVLFILLTEESSEYIRSLFYMQEGEEEYLDPTSTDMKRKMFVVIIESLNMMIPEQLKETFSVWADINDVEEEHFHEELSEEIANDLLIQTAPQVFNPDIDINVLRFKKHHLKSMDQFGASALPNQPWSPSPTGEAEPDSTSSPSGDTFHSYFEGPAMKLLLYPPTPGRGIQITTEDLICLLEGEFLNDVIIDFYLQYIYEEKLSEDDKKRTHIFSSFFYKRLTQRDRHLDRADDDAKKTVQEKRHAKVKKWTKTVDLFEKDFIIVPINEHSHWYLAVICFPGMANLDVVPYIPSPIPPRTGPESRQDDETSKDGAECSSQNSDNQEAPMTILGRHVDSSQFFSKEAKAKFEMGQKQPCILIFDSLAGPSRQPNIKMLREYLQCEWNAKKQEQRNLMKLLKGSSPRVPQQSNYSDCGLYLLQYVENFFKRPIADFQIPMKGLENWFGEEQVVTKRKDIHDLIMSLHRQFNEEKGEPHYELPYEHRQPLPHPREDDNSNSSSIGEDKHHGFTDDDSLSNSRDGFPPSKSESSVAGQENSKKEVTVAALIQENEMSQPETVSSASESSLRQTDIGQGL